MAKKSLSVDAILPLAPAKLLAERGFRRSRRTFIRDRGEWIDSVHFRTFRGAPFSFRIDLAIFHPFHHRICRGTPLPKAPSVDNATWLAATEATDWTVMDGRRPVTEDAELAAARLGPALVFFDRWESLDDVVAALESGDPGFGAHPALHLAILLAFRGEKARAGALLQSLGPEWIPAGVVERLR